MRLLSIFAVALLWFGSPNSAIAALVTEDCRLTSDWLATVSALCAILTVAENPADPGGPQIDLFVARVPSLSGTPEPDPVVLINGGPGEGTTELYLGLRPAFEPLRRERDIIILDQRGTGRSNRLACPSADAADLDTADPDVLRELISECIASLDADLRYYTTSVAVGDLETLRQTLDVPEWNIYGISYGTRVAQHYLRRYPEHTRALILDGIAPPEVALGPEIAANAQAALDMIMSRCADDISCAEQFPDLEQKFATVMSRLEEEPQTVPMPDPQTGEATTLSLSDRQMQLAVRLMSYSPYTAALLPLILSEAYDGNYAPLTAQAYLVVGQLEESLSMPMHNSVVCTEDVPFFEISDFDAPGQTYLGTSVVDALNTVCSIWPAGFRDDDLKDPLGSSHPVLLLSGEADPVTPPAYGTQVLQNLSNARHLVGPGQGHGLVTVGCVPNLMRRFVQDLDPQGLDADCLEREQPTPFFLDFAGPAP